MRIIRFYRRANIVWAFKPLSGPWVSVALEQSRQVRMRRALRHNRRGSSCPTKTSSPRPQWDSKAQRLLCVPVERNNAASFPNRSAVLLFQCDDGRVVTKHIVADLGRASSPPAYQAKGGLLCRCADQQPDPHCGQDPALPYLHTWRISRLSDCGVRRAIVSARLCQGAGDRSHLIIDIDRHFRGDFKTPIFEYICIR